MDEAPKSQDVHQAAALRGEPEAALKCALMRSVKVIDPPPVEITPQQAVQNMQDAGLSWFQKKPSEPWDGRCKPCGGEMKPGQAIAQTLTGVPDFPDGEVCTVSAGGPGRLIDCLKCSACGWSVTIPEPPQTASGCSHTARSDGQNGGEQGATPPAPAALKCGHHKSLMLLSAETGQPLYCELCNAISGRRDAELMEAEFQAKLAALAASPQPAAPEGWKLVPIEPTPRMLAAMWDHRDRMAGRSENNIARAGYAAMLAAAPAAEGGAS